MDQARLDALADWFGRRTADFLIGVVVAAIRCALGRWLAPNYPFVTGAIVGAMLSDIWRAK